MTLPTVVTISLKELHKNKSNFQLLVSEMETAIAPTWEQVIDWRSRWTQYVSIQSISLTRLREDMEAYGVEKVPDPSPSLEMVETVRRALWPQLERETAVSQ